MVTVDRPETNDDAFGLRVIEMIWLAVDGDPFEVAGLVARLMHELRLQGRRSEKHQKQQYPFISHVLIDGIVKQSVTHPRDEINLLVAV